MRSSIFLSGAAFAVAAFAAESSSVDAHPQTTFLVQTNSLGVVTGQPAVATSQPAVVTSQPAAVTSIPAEASVATSVGSAATIPDLGPGLHTYAYGQGTNSTTLIVFSQNVNGSTSFVTPSATKSSSGAGITGSDGVFTPTATNSDGSLIATGTGATSTGAAATMRAVAGSVVGVGAFMAAFL